MKKELESSKASFKLDLIETANADPMLSPSDFKVLAAYAAVMDWPSGRTWLAGTLAQAMTGVSERQFRESRNVLRGKNDAKRVYLRPARKDGKVSAYTLVNPWRDDAIMHVEAQTAYHRAVAAQKKAGQRADANRQNLPGQVVGLSRQNLQGQKSDVPAEFAGLSRQNLPPIPPYDYPNKKGVREEGSLGSNVVPIDINRRSA